MFLRFWVCSGVYGSRDSLVWLRQAVTRKPGDAILFAGGILAPSHPDTVNGTPWGLSRKDFRASNRKRSRRTSSPPAG